MDAMIETISEDSTIYAIIIRSHFNGEGIEFFTPNEFSQQLAYMRRPTGYVIQPHVHNPVRREIQYTKEVLYVKTGKVRVDFYSELQVYLTSTILNVGDFILLAFGGHGFEIIEEAEIIEIKQGPYVGEQDKLRFKPVPIEKIVMKG
jgi:hypothetical protein